MNWLAWLCWAVVALVGFTLWCVIGAVLARWLQVAFEKYVREDPRHPLGWLLWPIGAVAKEHMLFIGDPSVSRNEFIAWVMALWPLRVAWISIAWLFLIPVGVAILFIVSILGAIAIFIREKVFQQHTPREEQ